MNKSKRTIIDGKVYLDAHVVILDTDKHSNIVLSFKEDSFKQLTDPKLTLIESTNYSLLNIKSQHLYIASSEKIKEGDWCLWRIQHEWRLTQATTDNPLFHYKIIASTDKSLGVSEIPQDFIDTYIKYYNSGRFIEDVLVEYNKDCFKHNASCKDKICVECEYIGTQPKLTNNQIAIRLQEEKTYSREEVDERLIDFAIFMEEMGFSDALMTPKGLVDEYNQNWNKENLK